MTLPPIDFSSISATARAALASYGTPVEFRQAEQSAWRAVRAVVFRDNGLGGSFGPVGLIGDADSIDAVAILNPDDYAEPLRLPQKFDMLRLSVGGFSRTYTIESVSPIIAADQLPLIMVKLRAN